MDAHDFSELAVRCDVVFFALALKPQTPRRERAALPLNLNTALLLLDVRCCTATQDEQEQETPHRHTGISCKTS